MKWKKSGDRKRPDMEVPYIPGTRFLLFFFFLSFSPKVFHSQGWFSMVYRYCSKHRFASHVVSMKKIRRTKSVSLQFSSVNSLSRVRLFAIPWIAARQASLSISNSRSSLRLKSIESVMSSSHLILCHPLLLLPPIPPSMSLFQWVNSSREVAKVLEFQL